MVEERRWRVEARKSQYVTSLVRLDGVELAGGNGVDKNRKD